jgi:hypothetical protein
MDAPPPSHKLLAAHLKERFDGEASVALYRDNQGSRPVPIGTFGSGKHCFHSTIGVFQEPLSLPNGPYELSALGSQTWLANALATSLYWIRERSSDSWPLVCEDAVRQNARSTFRHMAFLPSAHAFEVTPGVLVRWLLGVALTDKEIALPAAEVHARVAKKYPAWLVGGDA